MAKTVEIKLATPIMVHGGSTTKIVVREPTFDEYVRFGDPFILVPLEGGGFYPSEDRRVIEAYMACLIVEPDALLCRQAGFQAAREVKDAILGFFLPASEAGEALKTSPTT